MKIYHTSDVHGYYFPTDYFDSKVKPKGLLSIGHSIKKEKGDLFIDGGDMLQGSPFAYFRKNDRDGKTAAEIMNKLKVDYVTIGNHDFNYGYDLLRDYLNNLKAHVICANVHDRKGEIKNLKEYEIIERDGKTIGITGAVTDWINIWEKPVNLENVVIEDTLSGLKRAYENIRDCDIRICIYHGGIEFDQDTHERNTDTDENIAGLICSSLDFDLVLTGHQHQTFSDVECCGALLVQPGFFGNEYAEVDIDTESKEIRARILKPTGEYDRELFRDEFRLQEETEKKLDESIGHLPSELRPDTHLDMALYGSALADLINSIQAKTIGSDLSITSFANEISGFSENVTMRDVLNTYRFPNTLTSLEIDGKSLKEAIIQDYKYVKVKDNIPYVNEEYDYPKKQHYNFDFFWGIDFEMDFKEDGNTLKYLKYKGKDVKDQDIFTIAMNNYRATGVGGFSMYKCLKRVKDINIEIAEILTEYIRENGDRLDS